MTMKSNRLLILGAFLLALSRAEARPVPILNVADLAGTADVIVLGKIVSTRLVGVTTLDLGVEKVPSRVMAGELHAREVLKGVPGASDITVRFFLPGYFIGYPTPPVGTSAIFFLNQKGQGYDFTSPYYPSVVGAPTAAPDGGTLVDRLTMRVGAVIESAETSLDQKRQAVFVLGLTPGAKSTQMLQAASRLYEPTVRLNAVAALLRRNDISGLKPAAEALLGPAEDPPSEVTQNLLSGIGLVKDPNAVPTLATLLKQGRAPVRRAAASALARTASPSAIDALAQALDDGDHQVRYYAVIGLADITGQPSRRPNADDFRDREASYLSYWKEWRRAR